MVRVLIKKLDPAVELPAYKTLGASGMDLIAFIKDPIKIKPKTSYLVPTGLSVAFSEKFKFLEIISALSLIPNFNKNFF